MEPQQILIALTYARITGKSHPQVHLEDRAQKVLENASSSQIKEMDLMFASDEYEARLNYFLNGVVTHVD